MENQPIKIRERSSIASYSMNSRASRKSLPNGISTNEVCDKEND